jgi:23S rRNA (cytosine1962-C5)-methyltransferase
MDPPPYGRGPDGEKWMLVEKLDELVHLSSQLLSDANVFFILSMYAAGLSAVVGANVAQSYFKHRLDFGEFLLKSKDGGDLPMGTFARFQA